MSSNDSRSGGSSGGLPEHSATALSASGAFARGNADAAEDPMIGQVIDGRYRIDKRIGEGGMGEVYAAEHIGIGMQRAIKILRSEFISNKEAVSRFKQEARSAASIGHKNIIGILDINDLEDGRTYLCMELLEGQPLNEMLDGSLDDGRLINILIQTGHGLAAAHDSGIVHRDMKPENIFVTKGDVPKLLDFGIAKVSQGEGENHLTKTGTIFGTPFYMAPEQALGQPVDHRADIYAIGVIMYEAFCGSVPFQGESFMGILTQHITTEPAPPPQVAQEHGRVLPPGIAQIICRCMAKDPSHRYQSMNELVEALIDVYRVVAGAGMSAYLDAHVPYVPLDGSGSQPMMAASSPSAAVAPSVAAAATVPPQASYTGTQGVAAATASGRGRGKTALLVAFVLLLGAGGAAGYFKFLHQPAQAKNAGAKSTTAADKGTANQDPKTEAAAKPLVAPAADAGAIAAAASTDASVDVVADAAPKSKNIVVYSVPPGAAIYRDGTKLENTPLPFKLVEGQEPFELTLKKRRYRDKTVVIDGSKLEVTVELERIRRRPSGSNQKTDKIDAGTTYSKPPPPARCSPKWCAMPQNQRQGCCQLE